MWKKLYYLSCPGAILVTCTLFRQIKCNGFTRETNAYSVIFNKTDATSREKPHFTRYVDENFFMTYNFVVTTATLPVR